MEIIYYRTKKGYVPAKAYLTSRYAIGDGNDPKNKSTAKAFAKLDAVIKKAAEDKRGSRGYVFKAARWISLS